MWQFDCHYCATKIHQYDTVKSCIRFSFRKKTVAVFLWVNCVTFAFLPSLSAKWPQQLFEVYKFAYNLVITYFRRHDLNKLAHLSQKHKIHYTPWVKKGDTMLLSISLLNIDRFSQFFHRRTQLELCNKIINKDPTSPQICCYTTLWNVKNRKTSNNLNQVSCLTINQQIFNELHEPYPR